MLLLKFKERSEVREPAGSFPCSAFRWAIELVASWEGIGIGLVHQHRWKSTGSWESSHIDQYGIAITRSFGLGSQHVYYDGPHCSFSLGFLHFIWGGGLRSGWCKKCAGDSIG